MFPFIYILGRNISTYGIFLTLGVSCVCILSLRKGKRIGIRTDDVLLIGAFILLVGLLCGSLLYAFVTYSFAEILLFLKEGNFAPFGGLVYYGAFIGGICGAVIGIKIAGVDISGFEQAAVPFIPLGHGIGRIGCVMAGCCNGMRYDGLFAIYYPSSVAGLPPNQGYFPVQLLEALINMGIFIRLLHLSGVRRRPFVLLSNYAVLYGASRFLLEFLRGDAVRGIHMGLSTSQWISIALICGGIVRLMIKGKDFSAD